MAKILINTTATPITISDLGITIPANGMFLIQPSDYSSAACSEDIILPIANGSVIVNDGQENLTPAEAMGLIQGSFIKKDFVDDLKINDRLKVDVVISNTPVCIYINQLSPQTNINNIGVVLNLDNVLINSGASSIDVTSTAGEYEVLEAGNYQFDLTVTADTENSSRRTSVTSLQVLSGATWMDLPQTLGSPTCYGYHRNNASGENTTGSKVIVQAGVSDKYRYVIKCLNTGTITTVPEGTSLIIKRI